MENGKKQETIENLIVVSQNVRRLRGSLSQADFAKMVGISRATVHRIESLRNFEVVNLFKIADALKLRRYDLVLTDDERALLQGCIDAPIGSFKEVLKKEIVAELKKELPNDLFRKLPKEKKAD